MTHTLWKADEIATLERLWQKGVSARKIAKQLGRSRNSVIGKADRLHLPVHKNTPSLAAVLNGRTYRVNGRVAA